MAALISAPGRNGCTPEAKTSRAPSSVTTDNHPAPEVKITAVAATRATAVLTRCRSRPAIQPASAAAAGKANR